MRTGEMFYHSGCLTQAEHYFQEALDNADPKDRRQWLAARLQIVNVLKFIRPVEASNMNNEIADDCKAFPALRQQSLALSAAISFWLDNKQAFNQYNDEYLELARQTDSLPTTYDKPLQAMHEAVNGFSDQALRTIDQHLGGTALRHQLRLRIFEKKGDNAAVIRELKQCAATIDSLNAANYEANLTQAATITSMTLAQQKAEQRSSHMVMLTVLMALVIIGMLALWIYLHRRNQKTDQSQVAVFCRVRDDVSCGGEDVHLPPPALRAFQKEATASRAPISSPVRVLARASKRYSMASPPGIGSPAAKPVSVCRAASPSSRRMQAYAREQRA